MSELKVYHHELRHNEYEEFYLKYEADKVIAEKDESIDELEERIDELQKATDSAWSKVNVMYDELRHQKRKRCQAMAMWCESEANYWYDSTLVQQGWHYGFYVRWFYKWSKLADKFSDKDKEIYSSFKVRKWEHTEWHEPTVDYLFGGDDA